MGTKLHYPQGLFIYADNHFFSKRFLKLLESKEIVLFICYTDTDYTVFKFPAT